MAAVSLCQPHGLVSALPVKKSSRWRGFRSREIWERSQSGGPINSCTDIISSACVASPANFKQAATRRARNASLCKSSHSAGNALSSGFWSSDDVIRRLRRSKSVGSLHSSSLTCYPQVEARLFGPAIFQAAKLRVLTLGRESKKGPSEVVEPPRVYTVTHSDLTAHLTLAIAREINKTQFMGWYSQLQRDEVLAEWRKTKGVLSLHVHCHISGGNWLHYFIAKLRFFIFQKELPMVLEAILHGDTELFKKHPELQTAPVYVYFHSNVEEYNRLEYWGPLVEATKRPPQMGNTRKALDDLREQLLADGTCVDPCECCSRHETVMPIPDSLRRYFGFKDTQKQEQQL
ncbi:magnesium dechelatase [Marchantia polymorpha subsp. ruderalis]|uniref:Staygreen protein domain-containing protein n=2 Tax=Marchantia polymorpha TaxID=3197 RepID=A0A176VYI9_MARPO|nr:hypothetical protein AXG93_2145s1360 [Marchantia polymorpha subsp. ruderalis]PTQ41086.1 hypothetical protein MARPO_0036s0072 [Marchantia polymorpha]BBM97783.1 hypothetical protein Mp_1g08290 [Marchantia polymorpha subsp. ruderalis]|eukprot:PTQ41086.1 hypothetical protein MARPO_0036s0072 [Marchantia polymorpha]